jgi:hypothetical protein
VVSARPMNFKKKPTSKKAAKIIIKPRTTEKMIPFALVKV